jgi:hypothetical protein
MAYGRTWSAFLVRAAVDSFDPRSVSFPIALEP